MRFIPVIDLLDETAVHAVKGRRSQYRPVQSVLCETPDPFALATAFRDRLKLHEIYIADLNAIQGLGRTNHQSLISRICQIEGIDIILDAGSSDAKDAQKWLDLGVRKTVIGSETLSKLQNLMEIPTRIEHTRLIFSLDFKNGKILSRCPDLAAMIPVEALKQLQLVGWKEAILLNLNRVGTREGSDSALASLAKMVSEHLSLLIGGGIANHKELVELKRIGVAGVLLATALHSGVIDAQHIEEMQAGDWEN
jgi:phosphoribosylformimino-5-aminoimidazole carboxamide ribotide isomerase